MLEDQDREGTTTHQQLECHIQGTLWCLKDLAKRNTWKLHAKIFKRHSFNNNSSINWVWDLLGEGVPPRTTITNLRRIPITILTIWFWMMSPRVWVRVPFLVAVVATRIINQQRTRFCHCRIIPLVATSRISYCKMNLSKRNPYLTRIIIMNLSQRSSTLSSFSTMRYLERTLWMELRRWTRILSRT
jgi:hypothetical protein